MWCKIGTHRHRCRIAYHLFVLRSRLPDGSLSLCERYHQRVETERLMAQLSVRLTNLPEHRWCSICAYIHIYLCTYMDDVHAFDNNYSLTLRPRSPPRVVAIETNNSLSKPSDPAKENYARGQNLHLGRRTLAINSVDDRHLQQAKRTAVYRMNNNYMNK
jgi:hypothetical protein